jgi:hypothetical protein
MIVHELLGCQIPTGAVRPLLVIGSAPGRNHDLGLLYGQQPVLVYALISKLAVDALHTGILDRFPRLNTVKASAMLYGPRIQGGASEFGAVIEE